MNKAEKIFGGYMRRVFASIVGLLGFTLAFNAAIDPLWYFSGNLLFPKNFTFDERAAKSNLLARGSAAHDCLILGDSRTALLDETSFTENHCFNYAVSSGRPDEARVLAQYAKDNGLDPEIVIVGLRASCMAVNTATGASSADEANGLMRDGLDPAAVLCATEDGLTADDPFANIPDFILEGSEPAPVLLTYLSIDAIEFSLRTIAYEFLYRKPPSRFYDHEFRGRTPPSTAASKFDYGLGDPKKITGYVNNDADEFDRIRQIYPNAKIIGYIPFASSWEIADLQSRGLLTDYLTAMHAVASSFDDFYDFSIPSAVTSDRSMTYDGVHYHSFANDSIARTIDTGKLEVGIKVTGLDLKSYTEAYERALLAYEGLAN